MTILRPEHFFEQAEKLIVAPSAGQPRQVDLRRAISSAYYGLFHFTLTALADEYIGVSRRNTPRYALMYRSVSHASLKDLCGRLSRSAFPPRYARLVPPSGFGRDLLGFASAVLELQEVRHLADYDPLPRFRRSEVETAIATGRSGIRRFTAAPETDRQTFIALLLCPPR